VIITRWSVAVDLTFVLVTLRRAWWLLLLTGALGLGGAAIVNVTSPVQYTATVQQFVSMTDQANAASSSGALSGSQFALQRVKSYTKIATSAQVLSPVIDQLRLPYDAKQLSKQIQATNPLDTVLIELSVTDLDPRRAADTANAISLQLGKVVQDIEAPAGGGVSPVKVTVTEPASVPTTPVSPKVNLNLALGLLVGLGLGVGGALLRAQLDTRIAHVSEIETITGRAPLGIVPFDSSSKTQPLISSDQSSPRAEAFRTLRTNLRFADVDNPPKALVVTSALPSEGKSTSACNIALTLALNGSRVALIEADLRKPCACSYLGLDSAVGLTNVLAGQYPLDDVLIGFQGGLLTVLPAGPVPPNPSELLGSQLLAATVRTLAAAHDYVIIDAAPLLPVTDAAVLASAADGTLVVVRHGKSTRDELHRALQSLEAANARVLGTVVNFAPLRKRVRGGYGGYGYGYGYGSYGQGPSPSNFGSAPSLQAAVRPLGSTAPAPSPAPTPSATPPLGSLADLASRTPSAPTPTPPPTPTPYPAPAATPPPTPTPYPTPAATSPSTPTPSSAPATASGPRSETLLPAFGPQESSASPVGNSPVESGNVSLAERLADRASSPYGTATPSAPYSASDISLREAAQRNERGERGERTHRNPGTDRSAWSEHGQAAMGAPSAWERVLGQAPPPPPEPAVIALPATELPTYLRQAGPTLLPTDPVPPDTPAELPAPARNGRPYGRHG
jgi:capsular exopolysaccharide synthesis family protein